MTTKETFADPKIVHEVSRMLEKEYGLIHNKDYHMTFVYSSPKPATLRIKLLPHAENRTKETLLVSMQKIYDHSAIV